MYHYQPCFSALASRLILCVLLMLLAHPVFCQQVKNETKKKSKSTIVLYGSGLLHLNQRDVYTEGPKHFLNVYNTVGMRGGADYEYTNKRNLVFSAGMFIGMQVYKVNFSFESIGDVNQGIEIVNADNYRYRQNLFYTGLSLAAGYRCKPFANKKITLISKLGLNTVHYLNRYRERKDSYIEYNTPNVNRDIYELTKTDISIGQYAELRMWYTDPNILGSAYVGVSYPVEKNLIKELRLGIGFTKLITGWSINYVNGMYTDPAIGRGFEEYHDTFRTVGITGSVVF